ncbi:MAG TPA: hypothetical protein ENJ11_09925 [Gammaproteobacteria bacterium]|nr:hypothetical protein [Gammaproteobacteria bacterium]
MRDYSNMPVLDWQGPVSAKKALAQVHHAEPLIIQFAENISLAVDVTACGCRNGGRPGQHLDCEPYATLKALADLNDMPELVELADMAREAAQVVDIDRDSRRIIIHD